MAPVPRFGLALKANEQGIHDLFLDASGSLGVVRDSEAIGQNVRQRLMTHAGEWFLNKNVGVPWIKDLLGKGYDPTLAEAVIKAKILDTSGVTEIRSFSVRFNAPVRELFAYNIEVRTEFDEEISL